MSREALRDALRHADALAALAFAEAVVAQAAVPLGLALPAAEAAERERHVTALTLELLLGPAAPERLRDEPLLLAAFFQNIDLLYERGFAGADAVSLLVMQALEE